MGNVTTVRPPPDVISVGNREVISTHRFNLERVGEKMLKDGVNSWMPVQELAKFVYGNAFQPSVKMVRDNLWKLRTYMLGRGYLMITQGNSVYNLKLYVGGSIEERQAAEELLKKMHKKLSAEKYEKALALFNHEEKKESVA